MIGLILLIPLVLFIAAKTGRNTDRLLLLPDEFYAGTTLLEFELSGDGTDRTSTIERLREPLRSILLEPGKTDAVMSCARELVSDMLETSNHIHITLREKEEKAELFIRSLGQQRALPASISDSVTAWENGSISYSYAYKMNIVYITLAS